ncbi:MAG: BlaI/MecI/CopY family transcriptional regulator [Oscillospiraceae bacterium]|nr:BlaI/MecI/CopY family transcriptional regulator [Oscillospiraceae bacterium]
MDKLGRLSETEMEIMHAIWDLGSTVTVAQVLAVFEESKGWKTSTLSTILSRLIGKGFLTKEMQGKVNYYSAALTLSEYRQHEAQSLLSGLYGGNVKNLVAALVDDSNITCEDINELREWFSQKAGEPE